MKYIPNVYDNRSVIFSQNLALKKVTTSPHLITDALFGMTIGSVAFVTDDIFNL